MDNYFINVFKLKKSFDWVVFICFGHKKTTNLLDLPFYTYCVMSLVSRIRVVTQDELVFYDFRKARKKSCHIGTLD